MMLREGWDVRNVTVVLGLRPFSAKAEILPEQVIGRGLRRMMQVSPDRTQTLEVLGTRNLLNVLRQQLEAKGSALASPRPIPRRRSSSSRSWNGQRSTSPFRSPNHGSNTIFASSQNCGLKRWSRFSSRRIWPWSSDQAEARICHDGDGGASGGDRGRGLPTPQELLSSITNKVADRAKLPNRFAELYPVVKVYVASRCFGRAVDLDGETIRSHLSRLEIQEGIAKYLARTISELTIERRRIEFDKADFRLSGTKPFSWRRNLPPLLAE